MNNGPHAAANDGSPAANDGPSAADHNGPSAADHNGPSAADHNGPPAAASKGGPPEAGSGFAANPGGAADAAVSESADAGEPGADRPRSGAGRRRGRGKEPSSLTVLLRIPVFRRLWGAIALSSLGDWLGLLATTALAAYLTKDTSSLAQGAAVSGVFITRLLPDVILAPVAGALVDRFDRRLVAICGDTAAGLIYISILLYPTLWWLLAAQFLVEAIGLFSTPAKQTMWVNIVPRERLAVANQLNYVSVYGMVPVAAAVFALLSTLATFFGVPNEPDTGQAMISGGTNTLAIDIALALNAASYLFAAGTVLVSRRMIPAFVGERSESRNIFSLIVEGISFVRRNRLMRSIYVGILGAFGAGGLVAGVAQAYVATLGAGNAGYGILFGSVFTGLALGMLVGPKVLPTVPRRMIFTPAIGAAGTSLIVMSLLQDFVGAVVLAAVMGIFAGIAWINGFTMIGHEVSDQLRGRVFAFVMSSVRIVLLGTIAVAPVLAGSMGPYPVTIGDFRFTVTGPAIVLAIGGVLALLVSAYAGRQIGGLTSGLVRRVFGRRRLRMLTEGNAHGGVMIAVEGADSAAVRGYADSIEEHLVSRGVVVHRISATTPGEMINDPPESPAAALRATADLADVVTERIRPALEGGQVVISEGFVDAPIVRFRSLGLEEDWLTRVAQWAAGGLTAELTVLVDTPPGDRGRPVAGSPEPDGGAHPGAANPEDRVDLAQAYRDRASYTPERYIVVHPREPDAALTLEVAERLESLLRQRSTALAEAPAA